MSRASQPNGLATAVLTEQSVRGPWARGANWVVGLVAAALLGISVGGYLFHRDQLNEIAAGHMRLQFSGPAKLQSGMPANYDVSTTTVTGQPVVVPVELTLTTPEGETLFSHNETTDEHGQLSVSVTTDKPLPPRVVLKVTAEREQTDQREEVESTLAVQSPRYRADLTLDKSVCRPGETIRYRAVIRQPLGGPADRELPLEFVMLDPAGQEVPGSQRKGLTQRGVGSGVFEIPDDLPGGKYSLKVAGPDRSFSALQQHFLIRRGRLPHLTKRLVFSRASYTPGDRVEAELLVRRVEGNPAAGARLEVSAVVDGRTVFQQSTQADVAGALPIRFDLPEDLEQGNGRLLVMIDDGAYRETIAQRIPINLGQLEVVFYPEGGHLVAGLRNRVYFVATDPKGRPVHLEGTVVDLDGKEVASLQTAHQGMGVFGFTARRNQRYRLHITSPAGATGQPELPQVATDKQAVLSVDRGVFPSDEPLQVIVRTAKNKIPLLIVAQCRGVPVGRQMLVTKVKQGSQQRTHEVNIPLDPHAGGVVRLSMFDYRNSPPKLIAQRLVYREPEHQLAVRFEQSGAERSPGAPVELQLQITDEQDKPVRADLGVSVVDAALPDMPELFAQAGDDLQAQEVLDLRLGTSDDDDLASAEPPIMFDNLTRLREKYEDGLTAYRAGRSKALDTLTTLSFFGGLGLMLLVAMLGLLKIVSGMHLWMPAIGVTVCCLVIGTMLMDPGRLNPGLNGHVPFASFSPEADVPDEPTTPEDQPSAPRQPLPVVDHIHTHQAGASGVRRDCSTSLLWQPLLATDADGHALLQWDRSDAIGSLRLQVDARGQNRVGRGRWQSISRIPFYIEPTLPWEVAPGDRIDLPLAVINDTPQERSVQLSIGHGEALSSDEPAQRQLKLGPMQRGREYFTLRVSDRPGPCEVTFRATAGDLFDGVAKTLVIAAPDSVPAAKENCPLKLATRLEKTQVTWGETVTLIAELANTADEASGPVVAIVGVPAGLSLPPGQLDRLQGDAAVDHYETRAREVICHWQSLSAKATVTIRLDLVAAVPGQYRGPASRTHRLEAPKEVHWAAPLQVEIARPAP